MNKTYINMKKMLVLLLMLVGFTSNAQLCLGTGTNYAAANPNGLAYGDFNNDGNLDIVSSIYTNAPASSSVCLYIGNGSGGFTPSFTASAGIPGAYKLVAGFYSGNNANLDLVVSSVTTGDVSVISGNGNGSFNSPVTYSAPVAAINDICSVDFNNDGNKDIAAVSSNSVYILFGNGTTFTSVTSYSSGITNVNSITSALLNNDAYYDFVLTSSSNNMISVLLTSGVGTFSTPATYNASNFHSDSYVCDLNSDNNMDIVLSSSTTQSIQVLLGTGGGAFSTATNYPSTRFISIVCADFNVDGRMDLAGVTGTLNTMGVMLGSGTGSFSPATGSTTFTYGVNSTEIISADFNLNGNADVAFTSYGTGAGTLTAMMNGAAGLNASSWVLCSGSPATLTAYGASSYSLNGSSSSATTVVTPNTNTSYTLTGNTGGCTTTVVRTITVNALPSLTVSGINPICIGSTSNFSVSGANTYSWSTGSTLSAVALSPTINTTYSVIGTNTNNCSSTYTMVLAVNPLPNLLISGQNVICVGNSATLTASGASTYTWVAPSSNATTVVVSPTSNAVYYVSGTDANGCTNITLKSITVNQLPIVTISGSTVICYGNSTNLNAGGALNYNWSNGANAPSILVSPTTNTMYSVTGTDVSGCVGTSSVNIVVNPLPIVSISGTSVMCSGNTATLSASGAVTYAWSNTSTLSSIVVVPNSTTTYSVVGVDGNGCIASASHTVVVNATPTLNLNGANVICLGESSTLTISGADTYTWNDGSNLSNLVINPTSNSTYSVVGLSNNGCSSSAAITVSVSECVGVVQNTKQSIGLNVYPNPNNGEFTIQSENDLTVKIVNQLGQVVYSDVLSAENNKKINVSNLPVGLYYVVCSDGQSSVSKAVIVK